MKKALKVGIDRMREELEAEVRLGPQQQKGYLKNGHFCLRKMFQRDQ